MKNLIIIPTYWTLPAKRTGEIFDHPTPIDKESTLGRLLESIRKLKIREDIVVFPTPIYKKVIKKNREIIKKFPELNINLFNTIFYKKVKSLLRDSRMPPLFRSEINLEDYGSIRNLGFIIGAMWGADNLIHLDDDEVIEEKDYFKLAVDGIGKKFGRKPLVAKTGYYIDKDGSYMPPDYPSRWKDYWQKRGRMRKLFNNIESKKRFHEISMALGGNMVINKGLYKNVPFDPFISRGEDMDLLLNAKHFGYKFMFDNKMVVRHLPPKEYVPYWLKIRRDAFRFIYQREKMKYYNFKLESLDDYPKFFLKDDLEFKAISTSLNYAKECLKKGDKEEFHQSLDNARLFLTEANTFAKKNVPKYFKFQKQWVKFMKFVEKR
ncbi:hypothetical protein KY361_01465 [Candidatus Woesearchaeota archaeon]|nr:hypothetical protein [Candidatus Woesearchaeota archaeon]